MEESTKVEVELLIRRITDQEINSQIKEYREYLEKQFSHLKTAVVTVAVVALAVGAFFFGKSWIEMDQTIHGKVDAVFIEQNILSRLNSKVQGLVDSKETVIAIKDKIGNLINSNALLSLEPIIEQKRKELQQINPQSFYANVPLGTIITSMLDPLIMESAGVKDWVLADGREVPGSDYEKLTNRKRVPDLRGLFLRGINVTRNDEWKDPEGERTPGEIQREEYKSHSHRIGTSGTDTYSMAPGGAAQILAHFLNDIYSGGSPKQTEVSGGQETRPNNAAVYFYIKIKSN